MLQVGSGSGSVKKVPDTDPAGQKSPDPDPHPCVEHDGGREDGLQDGPGQHRLHQRGLSE